MRRFRVCSSQSSGTQGSHAEQASSAEAMGMRQRVSPPVLAILSLFVCALDAHAYVDPATGSMILQLLLGILFAASFVVKKFWKNVKGFLGSIFSHAPSEQNDHN